VIRHGAQIFRWSMRYLVVNGWPFAYGIVGLVTPVLIGLLGPPAIVPLVLLRQAGGLVVLICVLFGVLEYFLIRRSRGAAKVGMALALLVTLSCCWKFASYGWNKWREAVADNRWAQITVEETHNRVYVGYRGDIVHVTGNSASRDCSFGIDLGSFTVCSETEWNLNSLFLGEEFGGIDLYESSVLGLPFAVGIVSLPADELPFGPATVFLRRIASHLRHRKGGVLLYVRNAPSIFAPIFVGFFEQSYLKDVNLLNRPMQSLLPWRRLGIFGRRIQYVVHPTSG
jgi:hypothetical protein